MLKKMAANSFNFFYQVSKLYESSYPAVNYMFKVNNRNTRTRCEICSKLTIKTPERRQSLFWCFYY